MGWAGAISAGRVSWRTFAVVALKGAERLLETSAVRLRLGDFALLAFCATVLTFPCIAQRTFVHSAVYAALRYSMLCTIRAAQMFIVQCRILLLAYLERF